MTQPLSVILHFGSITTQTLIYADSLIFSVSFRDRYWSQIHRWTLVNVYSRHALRECSLVMRERWSTCRSGAEYWLRESRFGHTINCAGIIWLNSASVPFRTYCTLLSGVHIRTHCLTLQHFLSIKLIYLTREYKKLFMCSCVCT